MVWPRATPAFHGRKGSAGAAIEGGQTDIRRLLIIGAMSRTIGRARAKVPADSWIGRMLARNPKMLVGIALANKMARKIWAMLTKNEDYRSDDLMGAMIEQIWARETSVALRARKLVYKIWT